MVKIIIIDDHPVVLFNLQIVLHAQQDFRVVNTYSSGKALLEATGLQDIDVALLDINLPDIDGFKLCSYLSTYFPHIKIIGISSFDDLEYISHFFKMGAHGYVVKGNSNQNLIDGIQEVLKGNIYLCDRSKEALHVDNTTTHFSIKLTKLEETIVANTVRTISMTDLSNALSISEDQMKIHVEFLKNKIKLYDLPHTINCGD